jgi:hypothetical protein
MSLTKTYIISVTKPLLRPNNLTTQSLQNKVFGGLTAVVGNKCNDYN